MTYDKQIEELYKKIPSYQVVGSRAYKPGIETMMMFDEVLSHPHTNFKVIHIAGTNGKGSVSSMTAVALASKGYKVALYTSPHLLDFRERIKIIQGDSYEMIPKENVSAFLTKWDSFIEENRPSFFEITTAMAFDYFASQNVDYAVIETGLGGRLDSTNVVNPIISIITNIGLEHCTYLGNTLQEIAGEKGGIIKQNTPVVIGQKNQFTLPVFEQIAISHGSKLILSQEKDISHIDLSQFDLQGDYQADNLKTVIAALEEIGISIDDDVINHLCRSATISGFHGRWEVIHTPFSEAKGGAKIICDIGHNAHGLLQVFSQLRKVSNDYRKIYIIFGVVSDKDVESIGNIMVLPSEKYNYIFTQSSTNRALPAKDLASRLAPYHIFGEITNSVGEAIEYAFQIAHDDDLIFIGGSNFTVADALSYLQFEL